MSDPSAPSQASETPAETPAEPATAERGHEPEQGGTGSPPSPPRSLRRPTDDRVLFGVASGLGRYLGIDPVIVRIVFVVLALFGGSGVLLYLIGLIVMPAAKPGDVIEAPQGRGAVPAPAVLVGVVLIVVGSLLLVGRLVPDIDQFVGPALLIALGAALLLAVRR